MGAFLVNFLDEKYDFTIPGVTSISVDIHKYGMSPKEHLPFYIKIEKS